MIVEILFACIDQRQNLGSRVIMEREIDHVRKLGHSFLLLRSCVSAEIAGFLLPIEVIGGSGFLQANPKALKMKANQSKGIFVVDGKTRKS